MGFHEPWSAYVIGAAIAMVAAYIGVTYYQKSLLTSS